VGFSPPEPNRSRADQPVHSLGEPKRTDSQAKRISLVGWASAHQSPSEAASVSRFVVGGPKRTDSQAKWISLVGWASAHQSPSETPPVSQFVVGEPQRTNGQAK